MPLLSGWLPSQRTEPERSSAGARKRAGTAGLVGAGAVLVSLVSLGGSLLGCTPYEYRFGEYSAGTVDPIKFPKAYLGEGGDGKKPGSGTFQYLTGYVRKEAVGYYLLPLSGAQAKAADPLELSALRTPLTYVFDPGPRGPEEDSSRCLAPSGYDWSKSETRRVDAVRGDRQGAVFTGLPVETDPAGSSAYVPIVSEVVVTSAGQRCQDLKSEASLIERAGVDVQLPLVPPPAEVPDGQAVGKPTGRFLAYAIIDPGADVRFPGSDGSQWYDGYKLGPQRWGWFRRYLLAYLDGGYVPTEPLSPPGTMRARAQRIFFPSEVWDTAENKRVPAELGQGADVLEFRRGEEGYSPLCRVFSFVPKNPQMALEQSVAEIDPAAVTDTGRLVYCLQTQRTVRSQP